MRYMVCTVDGQLTEKLDTARTAHDVIRSEVGEPGFDIAYHGWIGAFVNDTGHVDGLPRNTVAALLVSNVASRLRGPFAGPVVITGWDDEAPWPSLETCSLTDEQCVTLRVVHHDIRVALGLEDGVLSAGVSDDWRRSTVELAAELEAAPTPTIEILTLNRETGQMEPFKLGGQ